jgi:hypothetical protein
LGFGEEFNKKGRLKYFLCKCCDVFGWGTPKKGAKAQLSP